MPEEHQVDETKGRVKEAAGSLSGDDDLKREGKADRAAASAKEAVSDAKEKASGLIDKARDAVSGKDR